MVSGEQQQILIFFELNSATTHLIIGPALRCNEQTISLLGHINFIIADNSTTSYRKILKQNTKLKKTKYEFAIK